MNTALTGNPEQQSEVVKEESRSDGTVARTLDLSLICLGTFPSSNRPPALIDYMYSHCSCNGEVRPGKLLRAHRSPLRQLLDSPKFWYSTISSLPEITEAISEAEAQLVSNFVRNLRHLVGVEFGNSAWTGLTSVQASQFEAIRNLLDHMPLLVWAIMVEDPTAQRSVLRSIADPLRSMEDLATLEEDAWEELCR
ncbi:hypothetical protein BDY19DRAFT_910642 [Irpex rosettiformis]|uniref:Uncharacterized protein n=1 Tax=Irpex rosettiformis TaxID=378272 RepID=A0ACB8TN27_9APHY|nr:hypothetical protein BDY19DRAFT_910642 [Irpex rosettiformis]